MKGPIARILVLLVAGALALAACGGGDDPEQRADAALERSTGTRPPDPADASTTSSAPPQTTVVIDTTSGELPDEWPESLELPDDATVANSSVGEGYVTAEVRLDDTTVDEAMDLYREQLPDEGWRIIEDSTEDRESPLGPTLTFSGHDKVGSAQFGDAGGGVVTIFVTVTGV